MSEWQELKDKHKEMYGKGPKPGTTKEELRKAVGVGSKKQSGNNKNTTYRKEWYGWRY